MKRFLLAFSLLCVAGNVALSQQNCHSYEYQQRLIEADPILAKRLHDFEVSRKSSLNKDILSTINTGNGSGSPMIRIPVVVHVLYNNAAQNISDEQIQSQIDALNRDFRRQNTDTVNTPAGFKQRAADTQIEFVMANVDPRGFVTNGIIRKQTNIQYFGLDDRIKSGSIGGDDPWDSDKYLNIWVGSLAGALYGYASPVYSDRQKDGVVVSYNVFGTKGRLNANFNHGRIAVHEVGHWLGLRHIWGDRHCGDDYVDDTPPQQISSFGCPSGTPITCNNAPFGNMFMNYMDLTNDACTNMFTNGQKEKMRSLFEAGGFREALLSSTAANGNGLPAPVELPVAKTTVGFYPNPVQSVLTIDLGVNEDLMGNTVTLHNHLGQEVARRQITKLVFTLNMQQLSDGMYFVRIAGSRKAYKVIKASGLIHP